MKARYEEIARLQRPGTDPGAIAEAVQSPTIAALRTQLAEAARREAELVTTLGLRHPQVSEIRAQVRNLRSMIVEEVGRIAAAARNDYARARKSEQALAANLETLRGELGSTNEAIVRLRELMRDVQASRTVYEAFLVRTREVSEQERLDTANVRVISRAEPPLNRSFPPRTLILLIAGLILGVGLGAVLAMLREWLSLASASGAAFAGAPLRREPTTTLAASTAETGPTPTPSVEARDAHEKIARLARSVVGEQQPLRSA
jgi:succinoglycan biosynthesis transport protein ExoP